MKKKQITYEMNMNPLHTIQAWINTDNVGHFLRIYCIFTLFWNGNQRQSCHAQNVAIFDIYFTQIIDELSIKHCLPPNIEMKIINFEK